MTAIAGLLAMSLAAPVEASTQVITSADSSRRRVALTFDDGWNASACASIANTLRDLGAVGTFFVNGNHLQAEPARWRRILRGMPVANHTRSHPFLVRLSDERVLNQIRTNERIHEDLLGQRMLRLLRPPYGSYDARVRRLAARLGYERLVLWDTDSHDWVSGATVSSVVARATSGDAGSIVLMHCGPSVTPRALPAIIRSYRARGFRLVGLGALLHVASGE